MVDKAAYILGEVATAHALFYLLRRHDMISYQSNTWFRSLARIFADLPPNLREPSRMRGLALTILVKKRLALLGMKDGKVIITLGNKGRLLARSMSS